MRIAGDQLRKLILVTMMIFFFAGIMSSPTPAEAQQGYNAVCNTSSPLTGIDCSAAFFDASVFGGGDICTQINTVLKSSLYPAVGAVIDARGINSGNSSMTCKISPWNGVTEPSVVLLPAGTITIPGPWVLPDRTRVLGHGERAGVGQSGTVILAATPFAAISTSNNPAAMIQFGTAACTGVSAVYFGISIQDVMLDGAGQSIDGILNCHAQELSYVRNVNLFMINGAGLEVSGTQAQNSGAYENIACTPGSGYSSSTVCVDINNVPGTRGVHGLTATVSSTASSPGPVAAVLLDSPNTTIEDAHFEGFQDGILIGANGPPYSAVVFNVSGSTGAGPMNNVVEISSANLPNAVSLLGISSAGVPNTIKDDETGTTITDPYVGVYFLGGQQSGGFTRFTNSTSAATWVVGNGPPSSTSTPQCPTGSIFSNSTGVAGSTFYVCVNGAWKDVE
jgi:hypothetical protein